jgi:hypothetical protein
VTELEEARLRRLPLATDLAASQSRTAAVSEPTLLGAPALPSPAVRSRNLGMPTAFEPEPEPAVRRDAGASEAGAAGE